MRIERMVLKEYAATCLLLVVLIMCDDLNAGIVPVRNPLAGILDSSHIVIVKQETGDIFHIEEVFLGDAKAGDTIHLPGFRLYTLQPHGSERVDPITPNTRVLLYLKHKGKDQKTWEITCGGYCFFWVQDPSKVDELRNWAKQAVALRASWENARDIPDARQRVEALWPYYWDHMGLFRHHTKRELEKIGAIAGDYIAQQLATLTSAQRMELLRGLGMYGSEQLHRALIHHLKTEQKHYENFLAERGPDAKDMLENWKENWNQAYQEIRDIYNELCYGLVGLASFKDPGDLPFVRELTIWAVKHRFKATCEAALDVFRDMPDKANLPVIEAVWEEFSRRPYQREELSPFSVTRALRTHKFPETISLLVRFLGERNPGSQIQGYSVSQQARAFLSEIVGENLGPDPQAWLGWYAMQQKKHR